MYFVDTVHKSLFSLCMFSQLVNDVETLQADVTVDVYLPVSRFIVSETFGVPIDVFA